MKAILTIVTVIILSVFAGCRGAAGAKGPASKAKKTLEKGKILLTVDFQKGQSLEYKFVSSRTTILNWNPTKSASPSDRTTVSKYLESMEMVVAYTPIKVDPYGLTTIKATCKSVKVTRGGGASRKDAAESLAGKTFTFTVSPIGKIEDYSQLEQLIQEIGKKAFRRDKRQARVKEPDMIDDFIAGQWFLWDSICSIEQPAEGVSVGQTWKSKLSVPTSMVLREARDVTYRLDEIRQSEKGQLAVIRSSYKHAESVPPGWPIAYSGKFQLSGPLGFIRMLSRDLNVLDLQGQGEELFNIDIGRIEQHHQKYQMQLEASLPLPGAKPVITINQSLKMQLLK
ncbi:MAG: hypothetical protein ACE5NM_07015 [Sedimentisphaerales bacterium]